MDDYGYEHRRGNYLHSYPIFYFYHIKFPHHFQKTETEKKKKLKKNRIK